MSCLQTMRISSRGAAAIRVDFSPIGDVGHSLNRRKTFRSFSIWWLTIPLLFAGRLLFGLSSQFFTEDESQIFLIGLRHYATGIWPYFGPDIVWTRSEIPRALQALLISVPLKILTIPESPIVLLNLLSFRA